jgi:hypothetical protein
MAIAIPRLPDLDSLGPLGSCQRPVDVDADVLAAAVEPFTIW